MNALWTFLRARVANKAFTTWQRWRLRGYRRRSRILFSAREDWRIPLRDGFAGLGQDIVFDHLASCRLEGFDLVVPLTMEDLRFVADRGIHPPGSDLPWPSAESIARCDDKPTFNALLAGAGLGHLVPATGRDLPFPFILKKRRDEWGRHSHLVQSPAEAARWQQELASEDYFCQAFVPGRREFCTHLLFRRGRLEAALNIEYTFASPHPIKGPDRPLATRVCPCPHLDLFARILHLAGFEGLACVNYKLDAAFRPQIFEVNPRFGGSLCPFFFAWLPLLLPDQT